MKLKELKKLLRKYQILPSKSLGQNFLIKDFILKKIVKEAKISQKDIVLEIGPGLGNLTIELAKKAKRVIAIEKDKKLTELLKKEILKNFSNVEIIEGDILKIKNLKLPRSYKIVANLPYYIVQPIIRKFLEKTFKPKSMVFLVQKEVAQRICAKPPHLNLLAISVQFYGKPKILFYVSKEFFFPSPKVDGAVIKILPYSSPFLSFPSLFFKIVKVGFSHPRKQILNNLAKGLNLNKEKVKNWLLKNKIDPQKRAENLTLRDWKKLIKTLPS